MKKLLLYIGIGLFTGWIIAMVSNFQIYRETTQQPILFSPLIDGIVFMAIMLILYLGIIGLYNRRPANASYALAILGAVSLGFAIFLYMASFPGT
ncbi:hypothetical protein [Evansella clarkii]|jgi:small-conductance mechanosensitive channel|uniref:hypothetical protein n=1 Tax=Evansella clarkii TaxID=79879 RepID=UPI000996C19E|nr:hypothetical protein [Evansella clarkii]